MLDIANVSKSAYYSWKNKTLSEKDLEIIYLITKIFYENKRKFCIRRIQMELLNKYKINVNHKKVHRIMKEYGLKTKIRKRVSYKHVNAQRKTENCTIAPNILNGKFDNIIPFKQFCTDVTYLKIKTGKKYYLSVVKDIATGEIVGHYLSDNQNSDLIVNTLNRIKIPIKNSILHSDRGALYSSFQYIQKTKELNITRSMSEPARPTQNAPIESFFGHLKDEIDYKKCKSFDELNDLVDNYIYYYNTRRYQWNRKKMAPVIYRNFLLSYQNSPI